MIYKQARVSLSSLPLWIMGSMTTRTIVGLSDDYVEIYESYLSVSAFSCRINISYLILNIL